MLMFEGVAFAVGLLLVAGSVSYMAVDAHRKQKERLQ
jgi:hypothetical protein